MISTILKTALFRFFGSWLSAPETPAPSPIRVDAVALKAFAIKVGSLATLVMLNFLLFVAGVVVCVAAAAHSFDLVGHFETTSLFWAGIYMGATALVLVGVTGWALLHVKASLREFLVTNAAVEEEFSLETRLLTPFLEGLAEGFRRDRGEERDRGSHAA